MNNAATAIEFNTDLLKESSITSMLIINDEKGKMIGSLQKTPGYYESLSIREKVKDKGIEQIKSDFKKSFMEGATFSNFNVDSIDKPDEPVKVSFDFDLPTEGEDIIYMNPMFGERYKENPFKSAERTYPVEMPYTLDETFILQIEVPEGYAVDEIPKSMIVKLNEAGEGVFQYIFSQNGATISFRSRLVLNRTYYLPEEYEMLREFFNLIVKKQAEQIVFKKK